MGTNYEKSKIEKWQAISYEMAYASSEQKRNNRNKNKHYQIITSYDIAYASGEKKKQTKYNRKKQQNNREMAGNLIWDGLCQQWTKKQTTETRTNTT